MNLPLATMPATLAAEGLSAVRGGRRVFEGVSFTLAPGGFLLLAGRNGSGKSTLIRAIAGLLPPVGGHLSWGEARLAPGDLAAQGLLIYQGHQFGLKPVETLAAACRHWAAIMGHDVPDDLLVAAAKRFGMVNLLDEPIRCFSSGQRHRAALMRFCLAPRPLWLMDEPTVGLDTDNRAALEALIADHRARGGMVIAASHDPIAAEGDRLDMDAHAPRRVSYAEGWV
ncbi:heme ABC exporter ATP-binding protein CcmA [Gimibacter soli]|uniref:Heme ABC exporter ATP-binding protein CcmA n=1 Tax=Gimibacter soli TaxID=3024400 RepID=A0AAF0BME9_9PROT|nr:heme ABC exporter ATP-binding protein CcmA [Gimibacter soli]WCL54465.1 heme ABC exporter ATP-binding protein CcmA [Gimibacter soli]